MSSSWQDLVNNNLIGTKKVSKAAILGVDGQIWAKSDDFAISELEAQAAARSFSSRDSVLASGLKFEGEKYFVLQADEERVIGKKESRGFFLHKTNQTIIIAVYLEGIQPEECSKFSGALADYFKGIGY